MTMFPAFLLAAVVTYAMGMRLHEWLPNFLAVLLDLGTFAGIFVFTNRFLKSLKDS